MSSQIYRETRRNAGSPGAPDSLKNSQKFNNFVDKITYVGIGLDGDGETALEVIPWGGPGYMPTLTGEATISGAWVFTTLPRTGVNPTHADEFVRKGYVDDSIGSAGGGDMLKAAYDTNNNGKVDAAEAADSVPWTGVSGKPANFPPADHDHPISGVTGLTDALADKAPLNSPALTGNPTAPTQGVGDNTTKIATTAFVSAAVASLINGAPGVLDTLAEIAAALGDDPNFAATITAQLSGKLTTSANLSDVADAATARSNLGLGSLAVKSSITADDLDGLVLDGGTF